MLFTDFKNSKYFLRYDRSKSEATTGSLWEAQTKTANILKSHKIYQRTFPGSLRYLSQKKNRRR